MPDITYEFDLQMYGEMGVVSYQINQIYQFQMDMYSSIGVGVVASKFIDLTQIVPEKFRSSPIFVDYLAAVGWYLGTWLAKIDDMKYLVDPYSVSDELKVSIPGQTYVQFEEYVSNLASLIGLTIIKNPGDDIIDFRRQLHQAIDWYKLKGSYQALIDIIYVTGQKIQIKDLYTNNYQTFIPEDWFVADYPGENPPGLDSSYYKSPHFGLQINLNQVYYTLGGDPYLWKGDDKFANVRGFVEQVRPANTVPHYIVSLSTRCTEDGVMYVEPWSSGLVGTRRIYEPWIFSRFHFDQWYITPSQEWNFDDGHFFDFTNDSFLRSVTHWKFGTGHALPDSSSWEPEGIVMSGIMAPSYVRLYSDRTEYEIVVDPSVVQAGITQVGLYLPDDTTLVIGCTFPEIDKIEGVELRILIVMYK